MNKALAISLVAYFAIGTALAAGHQRRPPGPPPEAIEACEGKSEGDACSFEGREDEQLDGTCRSGPDGQGELACAPENHRR